MVTELEADVPFLLNIINVVLSAKENYAMVKRVPINDGTLALAIIKTTCNLFYKTFGENKHADRFENITI